MRIKRKIKIESGYDYPIYRGGWIEIKVVKIKLED